MLGTKNNYYKKGILLILVLFTLASSECEFEFPSRDPCANDPDSRHCYQDLAVERGDPSYCEKIEAPEGFDKSNPPKDKCYLMVAESTGDPNHCLKMIGGEGSYEKNDCIISVATQEKNFEACDMLRGTNKEECYESIGKTIKLSDLSETQNKIRDIENKLKYDWRNQELQKELRELKKQQDLMYSNSPPEIQRDYFRNEREKLFEDVEDEELKRMIAKDFTSFRGQNKDATVTELLQRMEQIKEEKQTLQRIDQEANKLIDDMKNNIITYGSGKAQEAVNAATSHAWEWSFSRGSEEMKWQMSRLEDMKNKYDRASAQYQAINEQIDKFKKIYDEVNEVYSKVEEFNKLLAEGKIEEGHAEVLKGAVFLGKGLEYATSYVPILGSTMSTVSKETFDATVKFATKRARRTTSLNKCIEDPLNCDPNGITGY
ncbi:hypothetical protein KO361_00460 [Candidatus Woesearchaeota archaeon]|nr:hypothetical protein [Candidatus Woesearchaeota archaeon]